MDYRLVNFVESGVIEGLRIGGIISSSDKKKWVSSSDVYSSGKSRFYQYSVNRLTINIGATEDDRIEYIVLHIDKQVGVHSLILNGDALEWKALTLDKLIEYLDSNELSWRFSSILERIVTISLDHNHIEFVFSFFPGEIGLQIIQVLEKLNKPNR